MTDPIPLPLADKRDALRARIEAAERRNAERTFADQAREAATSAVEYTRANPLTVVGGALAAGLVIGLLTRPGRRVAGRALHGAGEAISGAASSAKASATGAAARGGSRLLALIGDAAVGYLLSALDDLVENARSGQGKAAKLGDAAGSAADNTRALARKTADAAVGAVRELRRKTKG